ncbi:hypothetical protein L218DRAFT_947980, partial [Marasmius fiardii PR-910]
SGNSLIKISGRFINKSIAQNEAAKLREPGPSGDEFISRFLKFQRDNRDFVVGCHILNGIAVVSCQTQFMLDRPVESTRSRSWKKGLSGLVSDAAHGWFKEKNSLLVTTSIFPPLLKSWAPEIYSYVNGATAIHYEYHFYAMMCTLRKMKEEQQTKDKHFAGVMDFSDAECRGFINVFVRFFLEDCHNSRTREELEKAAEQVLLGCRQHFRQSVTRVKRVLALVDRDRRQEFEHMTYKLLEQESADSFLAQCVQIKLLLVAQEHEAEYDGVSIALNLYLRGNQIALWKTTVRAMLTNAVRDWSNQTKPHTRQGQT